MEKKDFSSTITAKISASEAINRISNVPEWWGITTGKGEFDKSKK